MDKIMTGTSEGLDTDELLHLAINASQSGEAEKAINYLKRSLDIKPDDGKSMYMLGSLHAELGMYDRAIDEIHKAIELEPEIYTAHYQLGLLYITSGKVDEAIQAWKALDNLDKDHYLRLFSDGMQNLVADNFEESIRLLQKGIMNNQENMPLNNDMIKMIKTIEETTAQMAVMSGKENQSESDAKKESDANRILSAYNNDFNN